MSHSTDEPSTPTMTAPAHEPLPMGTRVSVTGKSVCGDSEIDDSAARIGDQYDVFAYSAPGEGDDPLGRDYYLLDDEHSAGGSHWAYPEHVEVVRTVEQQAARKPPKAKILRAVVASALHSAFGEIDVDETQHEGKRAVRVYATTADGLRISFRVRIDEIEEAF